MINTQTSVIDNNINVTSVTNYDTSVTVGLHRSITSQVSTLQMIRSITNMFMF